MSALNETVLKQLFLDARTHNAWQDRQIDDDLLHRIYELARMAPTAANTQPMRLVFVKSAAAKQKLKPALSAGNVDKTMNAPVTAIVAFDNAFYEQMPKLFPARDMRSVFASMPEKARDEMAYSSTMLQAAYVILAARALGLDCGPMAGFDKSAVDATFFPDGQWKSTLLINLGHGDTAALFPRNPRLEFDEACRIE